MVGTGSSFVVTLIGALAFESLLGLPVVVRRALDFRAYSTSSLERRSILFAVSQSGESAQAIDAAHAARRRGAIVLALTGSPGNTLAKLADGVFLVRSGEEQGQRTRTVVCQHAALSAVSVIAARILKRPDAQVKALEEELWTLPGQIEWVLTQFKDAARSLATALRGAKSLSVVGSGFYAPTALQWTLLLGNLCGMRAACFAPDEFWHDPFKALERDSAVVLLSSSRCKLKDAAHELARGCRKAGAQVFAVTDSADRELAEQSSMTLLLPTLSEVAGSTLTLALLDWVAYEAGELGLKQ